MRISTALPLADRLFPRIHVDGLDDFRVCWPWTRRAKGHNGYQSLRTGHAEERVYVHRLMWELTWGKPVPPGKFVLHTCDNRLCCRPSHLWLGTQQDNALDRQAKGRGRQPKGEDHRRSKLKNKDVFEIRLSTASDRVLALKYGVSKSVIRNARTRVTWRHLP